MLWAHLLDKIKQNENGWTGERNYKEVYILNLSPIAAKHNESRTSHFTQNNFETGLNLLIKHVEQKRYDRVYAAGVTKASDIFKRAVTNMLIEKSEVENFWVIVGMMDTLNDKWRFSSRKFEVASFLNY